MAERAVRDELLARGQELFDAPKKGLVKFTDVPRANKLLNNLRDYPHAFVLACLMDRQIKAERAWLIPYLLSEKLNGFSMDSLVRLTEARTQILMSTPQPLHRFSTKMGRLFHLCVKRIVGEYNGDAARIWRGKPSSAAVVYRFLQFDGIGLKIATMATNILARDFKVPLSDYYSIDVSADVHVRRVFTRLGLCQPSVPVEQIIYKARSLHPEFPGLLDLPSFEIGRKWCRPQKPLCGECYMQQICPSAV